MEMSENIFKLLARCPHSYKKIIFQGILGIDGYKLSGFPSKKTRNWEIKSVFDALYILTKWRPDLFSNYIPICIRGTKTLCLDLEKGNDEDAPLVEVDLQNDTLPKSLGKAFKEWIEYYEVISNNIISNLQ
jgi:hypothetical protein